MEVVSIHLEGNPFHLTPAAMGTFRGNNFFMAKKQREAVRDGRADVIPVFLSDIPRMMREHLPIDVALMSVSPPDKHGFCSLGPSVDVSIGALNIAKTVIAQVNRHVPRIHGDGLIHVSQIKYLVQKVFFLFSSCFLFLVIARV